MKKQYLQRAVGATIRRALASFPAVVLTGARQTGKTTLLRQEFGASFGYASLEDPDVRAACATDPRAFLAAHPAPCILDEIQYVPGILPYIKTSIDEDRAPGRWLLTGSQHFPLMQGVTESLAGRAAILQLHGLASAEIPAGMRHTTAEEILHGGFPQPRLDPDCDLHLWMASYLQTYIERDVRQLAQVGDLMSFEQFVRLCAARTGRLLNMTDLARDASISPTTAKRWLSLLETSGQFVRLLPYHRSLSKRIVKSPKLYATDTGLAAFLTAHRDAGVVWNGPMKGAFFETLVLGEILKSIHNHGDRAQVSHWRSTAGLEIDFVLESGGFVHGIEVKANASPLPAMADSLAAWRKLLGRRAGRMFLACDTESSKPLGRDIEAVPWREIGAVCTAL